MFNSNRVVISLLISTFIFSGCSKDSSTGNSLALPEVTTDDVSDITETSAECSATIISDGGQPITQSGICWNTDQTPTINDYFTADGTDTGSFTNTLTNLLSNTTYYVRAYASNSSATAYGNEISFTTMQGNDDFVYDVDGNLYSTIQIGTQTWMVENLKVTHYRNGDPITEYYNNNASDNYRTGRYCNYNNDESIAAVYGRLYNSYAINDSRNIAPEGWHVPSSSEWQTLANFLGGSSVAGGKLKETGTTHWSNPNSGATNESGFTALPTGWHDFTGAFQGMGGISFISCGARISNYEVNTYFLESSETSLESGGLHPNDAISVRCIKD